MRFRLIFSLCGSLALLAFFLLIGATSSPLYPYVGQHPAVQSFVLQVLEPNILPAAVVGEIFRLPPAGLHSPNAIALVAVLLIEGFIISLALSFVVTAFRPRSANRSETRES